MPRSGKPNPRGDLYGCLGAAMVLAVVLLAGSEVSAETYSYANTDPEIEMWFYPTASSNGLGSVRNRASTFGSFSGETEDGEPVFHPGSGLGPARRGSFIVVSDTSSEIPRLDDPSRYAIDSLTVTVTLMGSIGPIAYDNTAEDVFELTTAGGDDPGHPIEMWGIGFDGDYTTFGFAGESGPEYFNEGDRRWPIAAGEFTGPYQLYSIDPEGNDVENAVAGGYSATEPDDSTEAFTPTPFGIGRVFDASGTELSPGVTVPKGSTFEFVPDLTNSGVVEYIQNSLAAGHLGFFFSSLHQPSGHTMAIPYPDFFLDNEDDGPNPDGSGPTLEIQVSILDELLAGDYNGSGLVEQGDLDLVLGHWGQPGASPPSGWTHNMPNGLIDQDELDGVLSNWGAAAPGGGLAAAAVPEPASIVLLAVALIGGALRFVTAVAWRAR